LVLRTFQNARTSPTASATYVYDADGQRQTSVVTSGSVTTATKWDYDGIALQGLAATSSTGATYSIDYAYDNDGRIYAGIYRSSAATTPVLFQMLTTDRADVRELQDSAGNAFGMYAYDAYGRPVSVASTGTALVTSATAAAITSLQPLRYASYVWDSESALYYCSQRYYDPATCQFISTDPVRADGEESPYQYCGGDPVQLVDEDGCEPHGYGMCDGYGASGYNYGYNKKKHTSVPQAIKYVSALQHHKKWAVRKYNHWRKTDKYAKKADAQVRADQTAAARSKAAENFAAARELLDEAQRWQNIANGAAAVIGGCAVVGVAALAAYAIPLALAGGGAGAEALAPEVEQAAESLGEGAEAIQSASDVLDSAEIVTNDHHIVAQAAKAAEPARAVLNRFGISVQDAINRVDITANTKVANVLGSNVHSVLHTGVYYQSINDSLAQCGSSADVVAVLDAARASLLAGTYPR
jgi:RHS repeat-associated protein